MAITRALLAELFGYSMELLALITVVTVDYPYYSFNVNVIHKCGFMMN